MDKAFYFLGCIILLFGCVYLGFKILLIIRDNNEKKYKTDIAHFLSDLYKLRIKWSDRGEFGYVESIDNLIKFHGIESGNKKKEHTIPNQLLTNDALSTDIQLANQRKSELIEVLKEQGIIPSSIDIETEFKG